MHWINKRTWLFWNSLVDASFLVKDSQNRSFQTLYWISKKLFLQWTVLDQTPGTCLRNQRESIQRRLLALLVQQSLFYFYFEAAGFACSQFGLVDLHFLLVLVLFSGGVVVVSVWSLTHHSHGEHWDSTQRAVSYLPLIAYVLGVVVEVVVVAVSIPHTPLHW